MLEELRDEKDPVKEAAGLSRPDIWAQQTGKEGRHLACDCSLALPWWYLGWRRGRMLELGNIVRKEFISVTTPH